MKRSSIVTAVVLILLSLPPAAQSQERKQTPRRAVKGTAIEPARDALLVHPLEPTRERVLNVLRETADGTGRWDDARAAAVALARVADLIWESDPTGAQTYLVRAWESASRIEEAKRERSQFRNQSGRNDARREVMIVARKRIPELAQKWLEQMAQEAEQDREPGGVFDDRTARSAVLLQMAFQSAAENPRAAAELATESLRDGISFGFQQVLIKIQERDVEAAQSVFRTALGRLRTIGMLDPNELLILYAYLYTPGRVFAANTSENRGGGPLALTRDQSRVTAAAKLNPKLALEFLTLATDLLVSAPPPSATSDAQATVRAQLSAISYLIGQVSRELPEKALLLQARAQQIEVDAKFTSVPPAARPDAPAPSEGESREAYAERRVDVLEEAARREKSSLGRDVAYAKAALATAVEKYERGLSLAEKIGDESLRNDVKNWLVYRAGLHLLGTGELDSAYEVALKNSDPVQRAACLVVGSQKLIEAKNTDRARQWLQEARSQLKKAEPEENRSRVALGTVSTYGRFDNLTALDALVEAVELIGQTPLTENGESAPLAQRFSGIAVLPDFTRGTTGFGLETAINIFTRSEFENVLAVLNDIKSPVTRGIAVILLCNKFLQPERARPAKSS